VGKLAVDRALLMSCAATDVVKLCDATGVVTAFATGKTAQ
jgi:hypothetical protein